MTSAPKYNGSVVVTLDFSSSEPCWLDLQPDSPACGDISPRFTLLPAQRIQSDSKTAPTLSQSTPSASLPVKTEASDRPKEGPDTSGGGLSTGAKAAIAVAVGGAILALAGMAGCLFFRRRKRPREAAALAGGHVLGHDRRAGKGHEKTPLAGGSLARSTGSSEALRVQPVYDGFPGSTGYDDVRSRESGAYMCTPQSPSSSSAGRFSPPSRNRSSERQYSSEREELEAARLHSAPVPSGVVSYGPNPVTPSITPQPSTRFYDNPVNSGMSGDSHGERCAPSTRSVSPQPRSKYPVKSAPPPLIVSYGPNRITPTPAIASAAAQRDDSVMKSPPDLPEFPITGLPPHAFPSSYEPQQPSTTYESIQYTPSELVRHDPTTDDEPLGAALETPLPPPYAYPTSDFYAIEKKKGAAVGAAAAAQAELPPTKDGYYHFGDRGTEYELPGAAVAPRNEQLRPHRPFAAGPGRAAGRDVDEQKVLLDDGEVAYLKAQKARIRAARQAQRQQDGQSFEMQPARGTGSRVQ